MEKAQTLYAKGMCLMAIDIGKEIAKALSTYTQEVTEGLEEIKVEEAKETVKEIRSGVDQQGVILTGDYRKGWARKKVGTAQVVHNRTDYQLTHLLEKGHAKVNGGRVKAYPHIEPAEQSMIKRYQDKVERMIGG